MFLIVGEALVDLILDTTPAATGIRSMRITPVAGGSPFNVAIGLRRLGKSAALLAPISQDALGRHLEQHLRNEGVDVTFLIRTDTSTPLAMISIDDAGVPEYAFYGLRDMKIGLDAVASNAPQITGVHLGSVSLVSAGADALLDGVAGMSDTLVSLDPNVRLAVEPDRSIWRRQIDRFRRHADLVKVSDEDLKAIFGSDCNVEHIAAGWLGGQTRLVVLTKGSAGCRVFHGNGRDVSIPAQSIDVMDTVGAGDTFMAATLCWLKENGFAAPNRIGRLTAADVQAMGRFAADPAAITCRRAGPDMPQRADLP